LLIREKSKEDRSEAVGEQNSSWADYGMSWDNSGKNGHDAAINWSNAWKRSRAYLRGECDG